MAEQSADLLVITALDEIAWLFNIRGKDIKYNPVVIAYALITKERALLFTDPDKLTKRIQYILNKAVEFHAYDSFFPKLHEIAQKHNRIWIDETRVNQRIVNTLKRRTKFHLAPGPIPLIKAVKNKTEIQGFRSAHIRDGASLVKFLYWLGQSLKRGNITELSAAAKLAEFRARNKLFQGLSFETISAYRAHSAIVHYGATPETDMPMQNKDIYLVDSGAQYHDATTDITRTICLGRPRTQQKECFTRVLKGLITLSMTSFPQGTQGRQLDTIARLPLWKNGQNYGHGTGHGIGTFLNVHEGPHAISPQRCVGVALEPGMITTIEPGIYLENLFGIRLENVVLVVKDEKNSTQNSTFYKFETLTLCPIDLNLVRTDVLQQEEIDWLNAYHNKVRKMLFPLLNREEKEWLDKATQPI
jgi:Xaa-Pro aminopeptidase